MSPSVGFGSASEQDAEPSNMLMSNSVNREVSCHNKMTPAAVRCINDNIKIKSFFQATVQILDYIR